MSPSQQDLFFGETLEWSDVSSTVRTLMSEGRSRVKEGYMEWAERAVVILFDHALTRFTTEAERVRVLVRLAIVARFHRRFRYCTEAYAPSPSWKEMMGNLDVPQARYLQLIPEDSELATEATENEALHLAAFSHVADSERWPVMDALKHGFGGSEYMFMWLWLSHQTEEEYRYETEEVWDEHSERYRDETIRTYSDNELFNQVMNRKTADKLEAYRWFQQNM